MEDKIGEDQVTEPRQKKIKTYYIGKVLSKENLAMDLIVFCEPQIGK